MRYGARPPRSMEWEGARVAQRAAQPIREKEGGYEGAGLSIIQNVVCEPGDERVDNWEVFLEQLRADEHNQHIGQVRGLGELSITLVTQEELGHFATLRSGRERPRQSQLRAVRDVAKGVVEEAQALARDIQSFKMAYDYRPATADFSALQEATGETFTELIDSCTAQTVLDDMPFVDDLDPVFGPNVYRELVTHTFGRAEYTVRNGAVPAADQSGWCLDFSCNPAIAMQRNYLLEQLHRRLGIRVGRQTLRLEGEWQATAQFFDVYDTGLEHPMSERHKLQGPLLPETALPFSEPIPVKVC